MAQKKLENLWQKGRKQMLNDVTVFNIREYLSAKGDKDLGEDELRQLLSEFFCDKNPDVERFLKEQSIEFTKKNQSVTYLVFSNEDASLVGYFTITIKPITVNAENFSNTMKRKIARVSELDEENGTYTLSAYLIAQLGKTLRMELMRRLPENSYFIRL